MGPADLLGAGVAGLVGGLLVPLFGALPAFLWYLERRRREVRPSPELTLATWDAPLPARHVAPGGEWALSLGLLLLTAAALLAFAPAPSALLPLAGAALLSIGWSRVRRVDALEALQQRQDRVLELADQLGHPPGVDGAWMGVGSSVMSRPHLDERLRQTLSALRDGPGGPSGSP
jgi:hypothetical protein